jgi:hypothetical protein
MSGDKWKSAAAALALFSINAWITLWLFRTPYTVQMGSIEAAYIGLARYIGGHWGQLHWFPLWYGGIPFPDSYPPLLHVMVAAVASAAHISAGLAYHAVVAAVYALGPVALYWAARKLGAGRAAAFTGGLLYSLLSPSCWLVREIRADSGGWFGPRRLIALVPYGEGPHLTSLLFFALAIGALHVALEKRRPWHYVAAALALACVVLSNWIGAFALAMAVGCYLLAGWDGARGVPWIPRWLRAAAIGCYAYALAIPWAAPSIIRTIRTNAPKLVGWESTPPERMLAAAMIAGLLLGAWLLRRGRVEPRVRFGLLFLWGMAVVTLGAYWLHIKMIPQPERYHLEMDMAFWLTATLAAEPLAARLRSPRGLALRQYAWVAIAAACLPVVVYQHRRARDLEKPIAIETTAEYRISHWLGDHLPGRRVFAPGTVGFWMNAFSDTPMIVGGFDNGIRNELLWGVNYQIYAGDKLENALAWLKALGCDAIVGGDPGTGEVYHPYKYPGKLHDLPVLWRDGAEVIFDVPRGRRSLAHALHSADLLREAPPSYYIKPLEPFLAALDDPALPDARFTWRDANSASISADLRPDLLLYVQVAWDEGWNARVNGEPRQTWSDALGQMVVDARCSGPCTVELQWDGGLEMRVARALHMTALAGGLLWIILGLVWRKRSDSATKN